MASISIRAAAPATPRLAPPSRHSGVREMLLSSSRAASAATSAAGQRARRPAQCQPIQAILQASMVKAIIAAGSAPRHSAAASMAHASMNSAYGALKNQASIPAGHKAASTPCRARPHSTLAGSRRQGSGRVASRKAPASSSTAASSPR